MLLYMKLQCCRGIRVHVWLLNTLLSIVITEDADEAQDAQVLEGGDQDEDARQDGASDQRIRPAFAFFAVSVPS